MHCANNLLKKSGATEDQRIRMAYEKVTSQIPGEAEIESLRRALRTFRTIYSEDIVSADLMARSLPQDALSGGNAVELASWTMLVHSLLNLDVSKTRQ
jgi:hypothetical protein